MCFNVALLLKAKDCDRVFVQNDPVNWVDPWGLDWRWPDNRPPRIKPDKRKKKFWDKCDKSCKIDRANEYAEGRVECLGAGVDLWRRANLPIPGTDIKIPVPTSTGDPIRIRYEYKHKRKHKSQ